uniref:Uncharacterized protein n=1 Tax=Arundo donax TaxID=35708 RepID=A0A0A9GZY1_ARUDO
MLQWSCVFVVYCFCVFVQQSFHYYEMKYMLAIQAPEYSGEAIFGDLIFRINYRGRSFSV